MKKQLLKSALIAVAGVGLLVGSASAYYINFGNADVTFTDTDTIAATTGDDTIKFQTSTISSIKNDDFSPVIDAYLQSLRINLIDTTGNPLFEVGSNDLTAEGKRLIGIVGFEMRTYSTPVVIEGHTDSLKYAGQKYTNWELSTERALSARRELEKVGFSSDYIEKITGFADTKPLVDGDKANPQNRRISILVKK